MNKEELYIDFYFDEIRPAVIDSTGPNGEPPTPDEKGYRSDLWIMLVFRMLCWVILHDFDPEDVKIIPSNLRGSRIPVHIG